MFKRSIIKKKLKHTRWSLNHDGDFEKNPVFVARNLALRGSRKLPQTGS